ncbi:MAG: hypothetical protein GXP13_00035 [Gammaproteobacteria bacterium]|nr:hypothetical protein [Gammaproteobacteria bacterium]
MPDSVKCIRVDMQNIDHIETAVFSALLLLHREKKSSVMIELFNCSKSLVQRFTLAGINRLVTIKMSNKESIQPSRGKLTDINSLD